MATAPQGKQESRRSASSFKGRRGDPRMNKALEAKENDQGMELLHALLEGGFVFPQLKNNSSEGFNSKNVHDKDGVTLYQRKNQLLRRLRGNKQRGNPASQSSKTEEQPPPQPQTKKRKIPKEPLLELTKEPSKAQTQEKLSKEPAPKIPRQQQQQPQVLPQQKPSREPPTQLETQQQRPQNPPSLSQDESSVEQTPPEIKTQQQRLPQKTAPPKLPQQQQTLDLPLSLQQQQTQDTAPQLQTQQQHMIRGPTPSQQQTHQLLQQSPLLLQQHFSQQQTQQLQREQLPLGLQHQSMTHDPQMSAMGYLLQRQQQLSTWPVFPVPFMQMGVGPAYSSYWLNGLGGQNGVAPISTGEDEQRESQNLSEQ